MATSNFYVDNPTPHFTSDLSAVTLSTTAKALHTAADYPSDLKKGGFFDRPGKAIRVTAGGKITTDTTPGNGSFRIYWGTGADANGTLLMTGASFALAASQTALSWWAQFEVRCITPGSSGSLYCFGIAHLNSSLMSSPAPILLPASAAAAVSSLDLTGTSIVSLQFLRSGSTVETMTLQSFRVESLN